MLPEPHHTSKLCPLSCWVPSRAVPLPVTPPPGSTFTFSSISLAVRFVISRFSTSAVSRRKSPPAADSRASSESSSSFSLILNSFWLLVRLAYNSSTQGCVAQEITTVLAPVTLSACWCKGKVDVAPPGSPHHPQGEVMGVPRQCWLWVKGDMQLQALVGTSLALNKQTTVGTRRGALTLPAQNLSHPSNQPLYLQGLQVWPLPGYHSSQQLVLQALPCHQEVDESALSLHFWLVVWVETSGMQD